MRVHKQLLLPGNARLLGSGLHILVFNARNHSRANGKVLAHRQLSSSQLQCHCQRRASSHDVSRAGPQGKLLQASHGVHKLQRRSPVANQARKALL